MRLLVVVLFSFFFTFRALTRFHLIDLVVMVPLFARQEYQVYREAPDPRDQQELRDHPGRKDPWDHVETKAMQENLKDPRVQ